MLTHILPITNLLLILTISIVAVHNFISLHKHRNTKSKLQASELYPLVAPEFYNQPLIQQTVENNHEIHEINKWQIEIEKRIKALEKKGKTK